METTDITTNTLPEATPGLILSEEAQYFLHTAGRWARFLGIMGFVMTGLILLMAFFLGAIFSFISQFNPQAAPVAGTGGFLSFFYVLIGIFYFFMSLYLYRFGTRIKDGIGYQNTELVTNALQNLKSHFKLIGITAIVSLALYVLIIIGVLIAVMSGLMNR